MKEGIKKFFKVFIIAIIFIQAISFVVEASEEASSIVTFEGYQVWEIEAGQKQAVSFVFKNVASLGKNFPILEKNKKYQIYGFTKDGFAPISGILKDQKEFNSWYNLAYQAEMQKNKQEKVIYIVTLFVIAGFAYGFFKVIRPKKE